MAWNPSGDDHAGHLDAAHGPGLSGASDINLVIFQGKLAENAYKKYLFF